MADTFLPMTAAQYRRCKSGDVVVSLRTLSNGNMVVPAGGRFTVDGKHGGVSLIGPSCECCGVQVRISKVQRDAVSPVAS